MNHPDENYPDWLRRWLPADPAWRKPRGFSFTSWALSFIAIIFAIAAVAEAAHLMLHIQPR